LNTEILLPEHFYHIYNRGNNRETIFKEERNYAFFLERFNKYLSPYAEVYAYCLMPNHFHFLIRVKAIELDETQTIGVSKTPMVSPDETTKSTKDQTPEIHKAFRNFFMSYAKAINKSYGRTGSLFQQKFKRKLIDDENYFTKLVLYIHYNPVKANIALDYKDWKYSSFNAMVSDKPTFLKRAEVLDWFGKKDNFLISHRWYNGEDIDDLL
jgi:putative transposase